MTFDQWRELRDPDCEWGWPEIHAIRETWNAAIESAEAAALSITQGADEAAKAPDALTYKDGYLDAAVDAQDVIRRLKTA